MFFKVVGGGCYERLLGWRVDGLVFECDYRRPILFVGYVARLVACSYSSSIGIKCVNGLGRYSWCSSAANGLPFLFPGY